MSPLLLLRFAPWAAIAIMAAIIWGGWGHLQRVRQESAEAHAEAAGAVAKLEEARAKAERDAALLALRERQRASDRAIIAAQHKRITEFSNEKCFHLDDRLPDGLLPGSPPVPAPDSG